MQRGLARGLLATGIILKIAAAAAGAAVIWFALPALSPCVRAGELSFADPSLFGRDAFGKERARKGVDGLPAITEAAWEKKVGLFASALLLATESLVSSVWVGAAAAGARRVRNAPVLWLALAVPAAIAGALAYYPGYDDVFCTCEADQTIAAAAACDRTRINLLRYRKGVKVLLSVATPAYALWAGAALSALGGVLAAIGNRPVSGGAGRKRGGRRPSSPPPARRRPKKDEDEDEDEEKGRVGAGAGGDDDDDDDDDGPKRRLLRKKKSVL